MGGPKEGGGGRVSRRGFLKGAGLTAAGVSALERGAAAVDAATAALAGPKAVGPGRTPVSLAVNGVARAVDVEPRATLADVLRENLGLTGTKVGCDRGACGSCTVRLDGAAVLACMTLAVDAAGRDVATVEGLARGDALHPLQAAFVEHDAVGCGFCTPGMLMSCAALLARASAPTADDVREATSGHLCRCGVYPRVVEATLAAAKAD